MPSVSPPLLTLGADCLLEGFLDTGDSLTYDVVADVRGQNLCQKLHFLQKLGRYFALSDLPVKTLNVQMKWLSKLVYQALACLDKHKLR